MNKNGNKDHEEKKMNRKEDYYIFHSLIYFVLLTSFTLQVKN